MRSPSLIRRSYAVAFSIAGFLTVAGIGAFFAAAAFSVPACNNGDAGAFTPITGIYVQSDTVNEGRGCGTQPGQIYKYASVVTTAPDAGAPAFVAAGTTDCFDNAAFVNLCASSNGSTSYAVYVYAFTDADWTAAIADPSQIYLQATPTSADPLAAQRSICADGGGPVANPGVIEASLAKHASLILDCSATQQANVPVNATCALAQPDAAAPPDASNDAASPDAASPDAADASDGSTDGSIDAGLDASQPG